MVCTSCMGLQLYAISFIFGQICFLCDIVCLSLCCCSVSSANILHLLYGEDKPQFVRKTIVLIQIVNAYNEM